MDSGDSDDIVDKDVYEEELRIENINPDQLAIKAMNTRKIFGRKIAVKNISLSVEYGE